MPASQTKKTSQKRTTRSKSKKESPPTLKSMNPRTGEVVEEIPTVSPAEVKDAVAIARKVAPEWGAIPPEGRARILKQIRHRIYDLLDEIVEVVSREAGKPRSEALAHDVVPAILICLYYERTVAKTLAPRRIGRIMGPLTASASRVEWRPFGVVGCITPWNYPITNAFLAFAAPLFAGNAVVVKPSEVTPACGELLRKIFEPLPAGIATVVQGAGDVGAALVDAPCDKISFVGSPPTGRRICEAAAKHLTPVVMELGGQDAAIVCEDADVDIAASGILWGSFFNAGQTCCSIERAFVVDSIADDFKDSLLAKLSHLRVGGNDTEVGPLTFKKQFDVVERHVDDAVQKGARLLAGGKEEGPQNSNGSLWFAPTILEEVDGEMDVVREETFGPVLTITRVQDEDEALRRANEEGVNLTASIWTRNRRRAESLGTRLKAGTIATNDHGVQVGMPWSPWGGVGESGFGRLNGELGLLEFSVPTHVMHSTLPGMKKLWWYPYSENTDGFFRNLAGVLGARDTGSKIGALREMAKYAGRSLKEKL